MEIEIDVKEQQFPPIFHLLLLFSVPVMFFQIFSNNQSEAYVQASDPD